MRLQQVSKFEVKIISEISKFSILAIGQKLPVFASVQFSVFKSWVTTTVKIWGKREILETSEFSILGIGLNQKCRNLWNFRFSSKLCGYLLVFLSVYFFGVFKSSYNQYQKGGKKNSPRLLSFRFGYRAK